MTTKVCRVLSIQSHVVRGYVGNKSAVFPLQVLGFEVDAVNSVQFSNHTAYGHFRGHVLHADELTELFEGLKVNNLTDYTHILTGYVGDPSFLLKVVEMVEYLKKINPNLQYVCDPVMGDNGELYVPDTLLPIYRDKLLPLADVITPNQFETELLTGIKITNEEDAIQAMDVLHARGVKTVVISSSDLGSVSVLVGMGSSLNNGTRMRIKIDIPRLPSNFTGTGDLFAALLLAWLWRHNGDLKIACEKTVSTLQSVLKRTIEYATEAAGPGNELKIGQLELRLIQSKEDIEHPQMTVEARLVP